MLSRKDNVFPKAGVCFANEERKLASSKSLPPENEQDY